MVIGMVILLKTIQKGISYSEAMVIHFSDGDENVLTSQWN